MPLTPEDLFARLRALGIETQTLVHPPAYTVEDGERYAGHLPGLHIKNLFLCDAKKKMWLLVAPWDKPIDLKALPAKIGAGRLSFGSADRLLRVLGVTPGSVTPFAAANDADGVVQVVLEAAVAAAPIVNAHPLVNTMTTSIGAADLMRFLEACDHRPQVIAL